MGGQVRLVRLGQSARDVDPRRAGWIVVDDDEQVF
jgi:hypothetical protein